jgi:hypothetical protein
MARLFAALKPFLFAIRRHHCRTPCAPVDRPHALCAHGKLEMRFLSVLEACCAKPMRGFRAADIWLEHVSRYPAPHLLQLIPLLLSFPAGKLSNLCFEVRYLVQLRQLRLLGFNELAESLTQKPVHFSHLSGDQLRIANTNHRLGEVNRCADAYNSSGDFSGGHGDIPIQKETNVHAPATAD